MTTRHTYNEAWLWKLLGEIKEVFQFCSKCRREHGGGLSIHFYGGSKQSQASVLGCIQNSHRSEQRQRRIGSHLSVPCGQSKNRTCCWGTRWEYPFKPRQVLKTLGLILICIVLLSPVVQQCSYVKHMGDVHCLA